MNKLQALLFDVDGTLADTEEAHRQAFNQAFMQHGLDWNWSTQEYLRLLDVTGGKERMLHYVDTTGAAVPVHVSDLPAFVAELHAAKTRCYQSIMNEGKLGLRPGVKRLIREAQEAGLRLAIATTTSRVNVESLLEVNLGSEAWSWFAAIATGEDVQHKKPNPEVYDVAMQRLDLAPSACVALEDSINGLAAARAANLTCLITVNDYTREQDFSGADIVLDQFGEPGQAFTVLQGDAAGYAYVDVAMLRHLHEQHYSLQDDS